MRTIDVRWAPAHCVEVRTHAGHSYKSHSVRAHRIAKLRGE
jgi:hypothetical protein